jgi:Protein of unknown function (DUF2637)
MAPAHLTSAPSEGTGSTMDGMAKHSRLTVVGKWWLGVAVFFMVAGMGVAFWFSFANLSAAAAQHGWHPAYLLPLEIDTGIPVYVIIDQLIVSLGWRSLLPRLAAWAFAALTVVLNGALSSDPALVWRIAHAAMPASWILGIEVLRLIWRALGKDPAAQADQIPGSRWLAAPLPTFFLWRRKQLLGVKSWPLMCEMEDARVYLRDTLRSVRARHRGVPVPGSVRRAIRSGRFPGSVRVAVESGLEWGGASRWEPEMDTWLASRLGLPETVSAALANPVPAPVSAPLPAGVPAEGSEGVPDPAADPVPPLSDDGRSDPPGKALRKVLRQGVRKSTDEELIAAVGDLAAQAAAEGKELSLGAVERGLKGSHGGIGPDRARRVLKAHRDAQAQVIPLRGVG